MELLYITANLVGKTRIAKLNGREYIVAPLSLINPGVLNGSKGPLYYSHKDISERVNDWNGMPLVVYHPVRNGKHVSARDPDILNSQGIGMVLKSRFNGKLVAEGWFDVEATKRVDNRVLEALKSGRPIELSTGLFTDNIPAPPGSHYNGRTYSHIATNHKPDHVAILPDQVGACSIQDGCGVLVNDGYVVKALESQTMNNSVKLPENRSQLTIGKAREALSEMGLVLGEPVYNKTTCITTYTVIEPTGNARSVSSEEIKDLVYGNVTDNEWSDVSREAAEEARAASTTAHEKTHSLKGSEAQRHADQALYSAKTGGHADAMEAHQKAAQEHKYTASSKKGTILESQHREAANLHERAYNLHKNVMRPTGNRDWPQSKRDKAPAKDFAGPHQSFPIETQADVDAAAHLIGKADDPEAVKSKIKAIAKKKGLSVPESWNSTHNNEGGADMPTLTQAQRTKVIGTLCTNCACEAANVWNEDDREVLNELSDDKLIGLLDSRNRLLEQEAVVNVVRKITGKNLTVNEMPAALAKYHKDKAKGKKDDEEGEDSDADEGNDKEEGSGDEPSGNRGRSKPLTTNQWLRTAPAEVQAIVRNGLRRDAEEKKALIRTIVANENNLFEEEELAKMTTEQLRPIANLASGGQLGREEDSLPLFVGQAAPATLNRSRNDGFDSKAILPLPTINYKELVEEQKQRKQA